MGSIFKFSRRESAVSEAFAGQLVRFYQLTPFALLRLRGLLSPLARAVSLLLATFVEKQKPNGYSTREVRQPDGSVMLTTDVLGVDTDYLLEVEQRRANAIQAVLDALADPLNLRELCRTIVDSMRDEFPGGAGKLSDAQIDEVFGDISLEDLMIALKAIARANASTLSPFLGSLKIAAQEALANVAAAAGKSPKSPSPGETSSIETISGTPSPTI